jgi:D-alanyl-D-alanine carboxypeptidase
MGGWVAAGVMLAALALGVAYPHGLATTDEAESSSPQRIVRRLVASGAPGAVAVVRTPTGTRRAAAGFARLRPRARMQASDRFHVASVTKPLVATVMLQLAAQGGFGWTIPSSAGVQA